MPSSPYFQSVSVARKNAQITVLKMGPRRRCVPPFVSLIILFTEPLHDPGTLSAPDHCQSDRIFRFVSFRHGVSRDLYCLVCQRRQSRTLLRAEQFHLADLVRAANTNTTVNTRSDNGRTDHVGAAMAKYGGELCATVSDGRCYWDWTTTASDSNANSKWRYQGSLPLLIDGSKVRYEMLSDGALVERLRN
jgi:hypothetical protein